jgi:FkbM family methyltransferase
MKPLYGLLLKMRPANLGTGLKRSFGIQRRIVETKLGRYFADPVTSFGYALIKDGRYQPRMIKTLEESLRAGGVFVDIGAGEGYFSVLAARMMRQGGRVVAVEPQERLHVVFRRNLKKNGVERVVESSELAVTDEDGSATFYLMPETIAERSGFDTDDAESQDGGDCENDHARQPSGDDEARTDRFARIDAEGVGVQSGAVINGSVSE